MNNIAISISLVATLTIMILIVVIYRKMSSDNRIKLENKRKQEALNKYNEALKYFNQGKKDKAFQLCSEALNLKKESTYYHLRGKCRATNINALKAIEDFNNAISIDTKAEYYLDRAYAKKSDYDKDGALEDFKIAIELNSEIIHIVEKAQFKSEVGDYEGAIMDYNKIIEQEFKIEYLKERSSCKSSKGDYEGALKDYEEIIKIEPTGEHYIERAGLRYDCFDYVNGLKDSLEAIQFEKKAEYYDYCGVFRNELNNYSEAIEDFTKAIDLENKSDYFTNRAGSKYRLGDISGAIDDYSKSIEIKPEEENYYLRGICYKEMGKLDLAYSDFKNAQQQKNVYSVIPMNPYYKSIMAFIKDYEKKKSNGSDSKKKLTLFENSNLKKNKINYLGHYHPKRNGTNPNFDDFSQNVLNLKDFDNKSIQSFYENCLRWLNEEFDSIVIVPSHSPLKTRSGIKLLAKKIAKKKGWSDSTECLERTHEIEKLSFGGNRDIDVQLDSLRVKQIDEIKEKKVIIIDDVTTSGNSLKASKIKLEEAGASEVYMFAIGKTVND